MEFKEKIKLFVIINITVITTTISLLILGQNNIYITIKLSLH